MRLRHSRAHVPVERAATTAAWVRSTLVMMQLRLQTVAGSCDPGWERGLNRSPARRTAVKKVLIVDDSKVMRDMVTACLRPIGGLGFEYAGTGLEAIERLALAGFDLLVLDLNMPDVGGIEVIEFVRAQDRMRRLPILVVTTRGEDSSRTRVLDAGASDFLAKPFAPEDILERVRQLLIETAA